MNKSTDDFHTYNSTNSDNPGKSCPNGHGPMRWVDDAWYCPTCKEEWCEPDKYDEVCNCSNPHCQV